MDSVKFETISPPMLILLIIVLSSLVLLVIIEPRILKES